eukprot:TRINITY_DN371_c0_g2_i1.p1 TRINITY_DN371_c0_g2~~TRINITY_DN371_c0_g2_i1.p1  ORF type:complete len:372 (+),score=58.04 TRINITY_DN371_c0_g2_i1:54-1118(+)
MSERQSVAVVEKQLEDVKKEIKEQEQKVETLRTARDKAHIAWAKNEKDKEAKITYDSAVDAFNKAETALEKLETIRSGLYQSLDKAIETEKAKEATAAQQAVRSELAKQVEGLVEWRCQETKKRKYNEFSELETLESSQVSLVEEMTGGTLSNGDQKIGHYALLPRYTDWGFDIGDLDEVEMRASEHGFTELPALFDRANSDLRVVSIEKTNPQWSLSGSANFLDHHDRKVLVTWRSARPDFLIVRGSATLVNDTIAASTVLKSREPIIFVEVQSGGRDEKYGKTHLRMALTGAHLVKARTYYGLFIRKGIFLGDAQLVRVDSDGKIWIDGDYNIAEVPALCKKLLNSETELHL